MPPEEAAPTESLPSTNERHEAIRDTLNKHFGPSFGNEPEAETAEPSPPQAESQEATPEAKPTPKAKNANSDAKLTQLKTLAQELGLELDAARITTKERAEFRAYRQKQRQALESRERELASKYDKATGDLSSDLSAWQAAKQAYETGDVEAFSKSFSAKDWNEVQENFVKHLADPNYKKLKELERFQREQVEAQEKQKLEAQERAEAQQRADLQGKYISGLTDLMKSSKDKVVKELADNPAFLNAIYAIQQENYDPTTGRTVSPEQAVKMARRGLNVSVIDELKGFYNQLHRAFSEEKAQQAKPRPAQPRIKSPEPRVEPSRPARLSPSEGRKDFLARARAAMADSED